MSRVGLITLTLVVMIRETPTANRQYSKKVTRINGPPYRSMSLPYSVIPQKAATNRKDSQGSLVLHDSIPSNLFRGNRNGCEWARALVICGGVAINRGDFLWTIIVDRCVAEAE